MIDRKNQWKSFAILLCFVFLAYLLLIPTFHQVERTIFRGKIILDLKESWQMPMNTNREHFIETLYNENDVLTSATSSFAQYRNALEDRQLILKGLYIIAAMLAGYFVLLYCRRYYVKSTDGHVPLLSISRGGHAPPYTF